MAAATIVFKQCLIMAIYLCVGAGLAKARLVTQEGSRAFGNLLLYVVLPCVVVQSFCVEWSAEKNRMLWVSLLAAAVILALAMAVAHLLFGKDGIEDFGAAFSNAGFIGFPLVSAVLGTEAVFYAAGFVALLNALQWTYGQYLLSGDKRSITPQAVLKNPLVLSLLVGLAVYTFRVPVPSLVQSTLSAIAALNAPLAMIVLGVFLAQTTPRALLCTPRLYWVSAVRLVLIPLLSLLVLRLLPAQYNALREALFLVCAAPVGSNVAIYAQKQGKNTSYAVQLVCLSTLLSIVTMPVLMLLL